jgi:pyruvate dehydrogenase E1 component alpha subunit/2-oxoisovalerate dehydrogenase E1 component alpha subunit
MPPVTKKNEATPKTTSSPNGNAAGGATTGTNNGNPPSNAKGTATPVAGGSTTGTNNGNPPSGDFKKKPLPPIGKNPHGIPDWRAEQLPFHIESEWVDGEYKYKIVGDASAEPPPLRDSKYLTPEQSIEVYRFMLINRRMEQALEAMYKQSKVIGGLYLSLGQEAASCASAYALDKNDWLGPMIRNQGSMIVRGFKPRDTMMQYMARGTSPTKGRESGSHYGDAKELNVIAPISHLGDSIGVCAGVALGARLQGKNIACLAYVGDGGQSTGPTYEGFNFAAVQKLGVVLFVEHNLWAYSTPVELQFACKDLADRSIGYGVPGVIIDGTDANQVYDATHEAVERAHKGEGASYIEAKFMRMKGHAMHDAAQYVPDLVKEYWRRRDCIARFRSYLIGKGWTSEEKMTALEKEVEDFINAERDIAESAPMPDNFSAELAEVYFPDNIDIPAKYGEVKAQGRTDRKLGESSAVTHYK